ncbi:unnamed protein product [Heligmosomoides polygyrus]|uniref:DDE_Tnp_1_7 domain-containing protein n=1 Tax=Heligmosomoides polygyrus TaxID=6339 RepID=A0A183FX76_HELPZ|nr:unnamed protein product [Heligmosomoides polygyrus]
MLKTSFNGRRDSEDVPKTSSSVRRDSEDVPKTSSNVTLMVTSEQRKTATGVMMVLDMGRATPMVTVYLNHTPPRCKHVERCGSARIKWWRLKENEVAVIPRIRLPTVTTVDETWKDATDAITRAARFELGTTKPGRRWINKQAWLRTDDVRKVRKKKQLYHVFIGGKTPHN